MVCIGLLVVSIVDVVVFIVVAMVCMWIVAGWMWAVWVVEGLKDLWWVGCASKLNDACDK